MHYAWWYGWSFHSHTEEKSLVNCLFNICSVNVLVVCDVYNERNYMAMCANDKCNSRVGTTENYMC